jgi:hypothetical protein
MATKRLLNEYDSPDETRTDSRNHAATGSDRTDGHVDEQKAVDPRVGYLMKKLSDWVV